MTTPDRRHHGSRRQHDGRSLDDVTQQLADACGVDGYRFRAVLSETGFDPVSEWQCALVLARNRSRKGNQGEELYECQRECYVESVVLALTNAKRPEVLGILECEYAPQIKWWIASRYPRIHVDDVWQDLLLKVYTNIGQFDREKAPLRAYLFGMAKNYAIDKLRSELRRKQELTPFDVLDDLVDDRPAQLIYVESATGYDSDILKDLLEVIDGLPAAQKEVAEHDLATNRGMTDLELGEQLGKSAEAVSAARSKGVRAIRRELVRGGYYSAIEPVLERVHDLEVKCKANGSSPFAKSRQQLRSARRTLLELLDAACAGYLDGQVDGVKFREHLKSDIKQICEDNSESTRDVLKRPPYSPYKSLWQVYDELQGHH